LDAGGLLNAAAIGFQLRARLCVEDVGEVADVALWFEGIEVEGDEGRG